MVRPYVGPLVHPFVGPAVRDDRVECAKTRVFEAEVVIVCVFVFEFVCVWWARKWMGVTRPCQPIRDNIIFLLSFFHSLHLFCFLVCAYDCDHISP